MFSMKTVRGAKVLGLLMLALPAWHLLACSSSGAPPASSSACSDDTDCPGSAACEGGVCVEADDQGSGAGGAPSTAATAGAGGGASGTTGTGMSEPDGPKFLSFATNVASLTEGGTVTFTAILTDPQGIDDLIGGSLKSQGQATYGAFITSGQEGAYEMTLSWDAIGQLQPIEFASGSDEERAFVAEFFDEAGHVATSTRILTLTCDGLASCDGVCTDTQNDPSNCGACAYSCPADFGCFLGRCAALDVCTDLPPNGAITCDGICASKGKACEEECPGGGAGFLGSTCEGEESLGVSCDYDLNAIELDALDSVRCCCF